MDESITILILPFYLDQGEVTISFAEKTCSSTAPFGQETNDNESEDDTAPPLSTLTPPTATEIQSSRAIGKTTGIILKSDNEIQKREARW